MARRVWTVEARQDEEGRVGFDPEELGEKLLEVGTILNTVGGSVNIVSDRYPTNVPDMFVTHRLIFAWESFVPAYREPEQKDAEPEEAPPPELEPALAD